MEKLHLRSNVFLCEANGHLVFLDLARDEYSALDRRQSRLMRSALTGMRECAQYEAHHTMADMSELNEVARSMVDAGLLTAQCEEGKAPTPSNIPAPTISFMTEVTEKNINPTFIDVLRFFSACLQASWALRSRTILEVTEGIRAGKRRAIEQAAPLEMDAIERLVLTFQHLRPFYARAYLCLYDSLALLKFLAMYGVYPSWVYGVTAEPFYAHCWVQDGHITFNEAVEVARSYTPIMVV